MATPLDRLAKLKLPAFCAWTFTPTGTCAVDGRAKNEGFIGHFAWEDDPGFSIFKAVRVGPWVVVLSGGALPMREYFIFAARDDFVFILEDGIPLDYEAASTRYTTYLTHVIWPLVYPTGPHLSGAEPGGLQTEKWTHPGVVEAMGLQYALRGAPPANDS